MRMKYYKVLFNQEACHGGNHKFTKNKWTEPIKELSLCNKGYHLTTNPFKWLYDANEIWTAEHRGNMIKGDDEEDCMSCDGSGKDICRSCDGKGEVEDQEVKKK